MLTARQRRWFLAYWAVVGAISGASVEVAFAWRSTGVATVKPEKVVFRSLVMAVTFGLGLWLSWRLSRSAPKSDA